MLRKFSIVYFLFLCLIVSANDDIKIISSSSNSILLEYTPYFTDTSRVFIDGNEYLSINIYSGFFESDPFISSPAVPYRNIIVGVPSEFGNTIQVVDAKFETINNVIKPNPVLDETKEEVEFSYKINSDYYSYQNKELVGFGEFGLFRDLPVQKIILAPVQYDAATNTIKLYSKIRFRINFSRPTKQTQRIEEDLSSIVINFETARNWGIAKSLDRIQATVQNSVLATGTWYKFEAPEEGIYRIDRTQLSSMGIDPNTVDPRTIKIYNNGGYQLNETVTAPRPNDLIENAILIVGEDDGRFDQNDYILFYGRGTDFFEYDEGRDNIRRYKHDFSKKNFYFITSGGSTGKRINLKPSLSESNPIIQTETDCYLHHDKDLVNLGKSGRDYWGEMMTSSMPSQTFINTLHELVPSTTINYNFRLVNSTRVGTASAISFNIQENGQIIFSSTLPGWMTRYRYGWERSGSATYTGSLPNNMSTLKFTITNPASNSQANIDYFEIKYRRTLRSSNDEFIFYSEPLNGVIQFNLSNFTNSNINVFDISDHANVQMIEPLFLSGGEFRFQDNGTQTKRKKYIGLTGTKFKTPSNIQSVQNSNIRGITPGSEYIIIAHKEFTSQAQRLANYRANQSPIPISTSLVYVDEIYNEFSSGLLDPTAIRDFIAYAYSNWQIRPSLVLLFGNGDYDYFDIEGKNQNFIPTFQTRESLDAIESYPFDDFYSRVSGNDVKPDVGVGRLTVTNPSEAEIVVDKIIEYETQSEQGLWRNTITLVADDGITSDRIGETDHHIQSEVLSANFIPQTFDQRKIYLVTYPTIITGAGRRKPAVNQAIIDAINSGTLILNFIGHGNPDVWTHENVFLKDITIPQLKNDKYFFLTAATCDFGKFDVPDDPSATELMLSKPESGVIGAFTASRPVYSNSNAALNEKLFKHMLQVKNSDSSPRRIGTAYMFAKAEGSFNLSNDERFLLFGDPAVRLNQPENPVTIDSINDSDLSVDVQISALGNVDITGSFKNLDGSQSNFSGEAVISVFDAKRNISIQELGYTYRISQQGGLIFRGRVTVSNGKFNTNFTVPKDISYQNENGKVVVYAFNNEVDGSGYTERIIVGGTDTSSVNDGRGPNIEIYFDDLSFDNSYLVSSNFTLLVKLEDETGINTTGSGVGHNLEGIINDDENNPIDLTSNFVGDLDAGGKSGVVSYRFSNFDEGDHKIRIKAWDVFNNLSTEETFFSVVNSDQLAIREVVNYPNPFSSNTTFTFQQNLTKTLNVKVKIYTIAGRLIKEIEQYNILDKFIRIPWDGRDHDGDQLANGTYLYKLIIESTDKEFRETVLGKLAVIR